MNNLYTETERLARWMRDYADNAGSKGFVIGLSGGIDSSLVACLAVRAVGAENVIGASLPCDTRQDMKDDAEELAKNLGIQFVTIPLAKAVADLYQTFQEAMNHNPTKFMVANWKARLRMTALYGVSNYKNYLVAGTGNKSELMVGYFTKFGDGGVDMEPLGQFYKTEVYKMAAFFDAIPENVITKAPSADLWEGQTDEEELGMTYEKLDTILSRTAPYGTYFDYGDGITEEEFNKVMGMIVKSDHKNNVPPQYPRS